MIQDSDPHALGEPGGALGYYTIKHSVAVKFDLYNNSGEGFDSTGLFVNGTYPDNNASTTDLKPDGIDLHSGHPFRVDISYTGTKMKVLITDLQTKAVATRTYTINIATTIGASTAYVGFTGSTGGDAATQKILTWEYLSQ